MQTIRKLPRLLCAWLIGALLPTLALTATPAAEPIPRDLDAQLLLLQKWMTGHFSNARQVREQLADGVKPEDAPRWDLVIVPANLPRYGDHVLYAEYYLDGDPTNVVRQRLYSLHVDPKAKAIRVDMGVLEEGVPKDRRRFVEAYRNPAELSRMTDADVSFKTPNCSFWFRPEGRQFRGEFRRRTCIFDMPDRGQFYSWHHYVIGPDLHWFVGGWHDMDDHPIPNPPKLMHYLPDWFELDRVRE